MGRRLFDLTLAGIGWLLLAPLWLIAIAGIRWTSPGPVFYRARRVGHGRAEFMLYKFRTMHVAAEPGAPITAAQDSRIFPFGKWLRDWKVDELPQLINVFKGEMSIVGPRPEDPIIVRDHYSAEDLETLDVLPGLASPGSIFSYTHGEESLVGEDATALYANRLLPIKLALDRVYVQQASIGYDIRIIARTIHVLILRAMGRRQFPNPPEFTRLRTRNSALSPTPSRSEVGG